mmetsp:Transcript_123977/g.193523  ORF Transcript_123977/g.193523 Transcript_123977/m.193523 type:complete len:591 (-) Transcript_123977:92-1864(-)
MEVRIEAEGCELPEGSCICVRVGDVQKQTAYDPKKVYRFPEARRFGKIDLYQRVGTCEVQWELDEPESRICQLISSSGEVGACLKVNMNRPMTNHGKTANAYQSAKSSPLDASSDKSKEANAKAKAYLLEHDIEGIFTNAMRSLLRTMPEDPAGFLRDHIGTHYSPRPNKQMGISRHAIEPLPVTTRPACLGPTFHAYYRKHVLHSRAPSFFHDFHARASWRTPPREQSTTTASGAFALSPSVGSWVNPSLSNPITLAAARRSAAPREEILRAEARECFLRAARDGSLQDALVQFIGPAAAETVTHDDGSSQNKLRQHLRERARDVFIHAHRSGKLHSTWQDVRRASNSQDNESQSTSSTGVPTSEALRTKFLDLFLKASSNGDLEDALSQVANSVNCENDKLQPQRSTSLTELRAQACASFSKATLEGTLQHKLNEAIDENSNKQEDATLQKPSQPKTVQVRAPATKPGANELNKKARRNLLEGLRRGTLEALVVDMEESEEQNATADDPASSQATGRHDLERSVKKVGKSLLEAYEGGQLTTAIQTASESWNNDLAQVRTNLLNAASDGSLAKLMVDLAATSSSRGSS